MAALQLLRLVSVASLVAPEDADCVPQQHPSSPCDVFAGRVTASAYDAHVLDTTKFYSGSLLERKRRWAEAIPPDHPHRDFALSTLGDVQAEAVFTAGWSGEYKRVAYGHSLCPPAREFANYGIDGVMVATVPPQPARAWLAKWASKRLAAGMCRVWGSSRSDVGDRPTVVNPITVEPSKPRAITAMCYVNLWATPPDFFPGLLDYCTQVPGAFGRNPAFADGDFHAHYDHYSIGENLQPFFGFRIDLLDGAGPQYFVQTAGGFGFNVWPFVANIHRYFANCFIREMGCKVLGFFDDCLTGGRDIPGSRGALSAEELCVQFNVPSDTPPQLLLCHEALYIHYTVCTDLGFFFSFKKTRWIPAWVVKWVGVWLHATPGFTELYVTMPAKREKLALQCRTVLSSFSVDWFFYDRLAGLANSIAVSCRAMRFLTKYLYARVKAHRRLHCDLSVRVVVTELELHFCQTFLALPDWAFSHPWLSSCHDQVYSISDADDTRWACSISRTPPALHSVMLPVTVADSYEAIVEAHRLAMPLDLVASGEFPFWILRLSIGFKELYAVVFGLITISWWYGVAAVRGRRIQPHLDNLGDVFILRKGGSTVAELNWLMETLFWAQVYLQFEISLPSWLSTRANFVLDAYTRIPMFVDAHISDELFDFISVLWGPFTVDLMATDASARCPRFFSRFACPRTSGIDVLAQDLSPPLFGYAFPPVAFLQALLTHLRHCRSRAVVLLPSGTFPWTPLVAGSLVQRVCVPARLVPFAFESSRNGLHASNHYNGVPYSVVLLDFGHRRLAC